MNAKTKILIVDDEPINRDFFDVMLSKLGFQVNKAEDGEEALEKLKNDRPDLIILDNIMPKMSGWKLTKILKTSDDYGEFSDIPIIMFSAMDDVKDKIEGFELGVEDYITKPFNFSEVLARIRAVLRSRELSRQVVQKERKIASIESLNQSLIYFTQHLKEPVESLQKRVETLDVNSKKEIQDFVEAVQVETKQVLVTLHSLEDEIRDLQKRPELQEDADADLLEDLEKRFQRHFSSWKENQEVPEVSS
ncbi:response regulator [Marispirochaeta aestuarii]|uniref:Response regulator n=1 Tax=Marispirochaeta aestuarii TaxID=1963862 RepID=A0A1Y1S2R8_9SPIO|nr:response regulator [Marispirochaeta aestuarii]ORC38269.1 response regulator [Marispirochaeta aestuarii]